MSPARLAALAALVLHIPMLAAAAFGHADPATLDAAGRAAMSAAGAAVAPPPGWPSLPAFLADCLAHLVPAVWGVLVPAVLAAASAAAVAALTLQALAVPRPAFWALLVAASPAMLAAPGLGWTLLAALLPIRAFAGLGGQGAGALALYGLALAAAPFLDSAILPAMPLLLLAGWSAAHGPMRRETPVAVAFFVAFPLLMALGGIAYAAWAFGGSGLDALVRILPVLPPQAFGLVPAALLTAACLPLLPWPRRSRTRLSRPARLAALGLATAAATSPPLGFAAGPWTIPALVLPAATLLAGIPDVAPRIRRLGLAMALVGSFGPNFLAPPPVLAPIEQALTGATPADAPWRAAIAQAPTLLEPADAALAAFAPPGHVLPPGSVPFRAAESRRWEAPQAVVRAPRRTVSRLGHANPSLLFGPPPGYETVIDDGRRRLLRRTDL
jgi:hypothetical protein